MIYSKKPDANSRFHPVLRIPGSKSQTLRALVIASLAKGKSILKSASMCDDTHIMIRALRKFGIKIVKKNGALEVFGNNGKFKRTNAPLFCGDSGTCFRFLIALAATQPFETKLQGGNWLRMRPVEDLLRALKELGAWVTLKRKRGFHPVSRNGNPLVLIHGPITKSACKISGKHSSQFISALLLASPLLSHLKISVYGKLVSRPYIDLTISMLKDFGFTIKHKGYRIFFPQGPKILSARTFEIEGDASSATYFCGLAALSGKKICISNISSRSIQPDIKFLSFLQKMGCRVEGMCITGPSIFSLKSLDTVDCGDMPDAALTLAVVSAFAKGKTRLVGLSHLKGKESNRLTALAEGLRSLGCRVKLFHDGLEIYGDPEKLHGGIIDTKHDHRIAMAFGMLRSLIPEIKIRHPECVSKSYPSFWKDLGQVENSLQKQRRNIVLIGMRGTGKTTLGKYLSKKLRLPFFDIDQAIERREKRSIREMVQKNGWNYFRKLERNAVLSLGKNPSVIATGGGTLLDRRTRQHLKKNGFFIFLKTPLYLLQERLARDPKNRPSLTGQNIASELPRIYRQRKKLYGKNADLIFDTSKHNPRELLKILALDTLDAA